MEEASGVSLVKMAEGWLKRTGHPEVCTTGSHEFPRDSRTTC